MSDCCSYGIYLGVAYLMLSVLASNSCQHMLSHMLLCSTKCIHAHVHTLTHTHYLRYGHRKSKVGDLIRILYQVFLRVTIYNTSLHHPTYPKLFYGPLSGAAYALRLTCDKPFVTKLSRHIFIDSSTG